MLNLSTRLQPSQSGFFMRLSIFNSMSVNHKEIGYGARAKPPLDEIFVLVEKTLSLLVTRKKFD